MKTLCVNYDDLVFGFLAYRDRAVQMGKVVIKT